MTKITDGIVSSNNDLGQRAQARSYRDNRNVTDAQLDILYSNDWVVQKFINGQTRDMTRIDREIKSDLDPKFDKEMERFCKKIGAFKALEEYLNWGRLKGDSIVFAATRFTNSDDEVDVSQPLNLDTEDLVKLIAFDKNSYTPSTDVTTKLSSKNYAKPLFYELKNDQLQIHHSRICRLSLGDIPISKQLKGGRQSFGISEVKAIWDPLNAYNTAKTGISDLIELARVAIIKTQGYNDSIDEGRQDDFLTLADSMKTSMSLANILFLDSGSEYETHEFSSNWVNEALKETRIDLSGSCRMPLTRLFGQSAAGFASGEEDNKIYYEYINGRQESDVRPFWDFVDKFIIDHLQAKFEDFDLSFFDYDFPTIRDRDEKEQAEIANLFADCCSKLFDMDVMSAADVADEFRVKGILTSISDEVVRRLREIVSEPTYEKPTQEQEFAAY